MAQVLVEKHVPMSQLLDLSILPQTWMAGKARNSQEINNDYHMDISESAYTMSLCFVRKQVEVKELRLRK